MSYELLQQEPEKFFATISVSIIITLVAYCAFPLIFSKLRKKIVTKRKYKVLCYCVNFVVMVLFIVINGEPSSGGPYILWTWVFSAAGIKILKNRGILEESHAPADSETEQKSKSEVPVEVSQLIIDDLLPHEECTPLCEEADVINTDVPVADKPMPIVPEAHTGELLQNQPSAPDEKTRKYCKYCGGIIDVTTKKCTSCGKQFFKFPKKASGITVLIIVLSALVGLNVYQYLTIRATKATISVLAKRIATFEEAVLSSDYAYTNEGSDEDTAKTPTRYDLRAEYYKYTDEEKKLVEAYDAKNAAKRDTASAKELYNTTLSLGQSITDRLSDTSYKDSACRVQLQKDLYTYQNNLSRLGLLGYDTKDARERVSVLQAVLDEQRSAFAQYKDEDEYIKAIGQYLQE